MVVFSSMKALAALALLCSFTARAVVLDAQDSAAAASKDALLRREAAHARGRSDSEVHLSSRGELLVAAHKPTGSPEPHHRPRRQGSGRSDAEASLADRQRHDNPSLAICDDDWVLGKINSSDCPHGSIRTINGNPVPDSHDQREIDMRLCEEAARQFNATVKWSAEREADLEIPDEWMEVRPEGCFYFPCKEDPNGNCLWYNSIADSPECPMGIPVCQRPKYLEGTAAGECPQGYEVIMDETGCRQAGRCEGFTLSNLFVKGVPQPGSDGYHEETDDFNDFPEGCFVHGDSKDVHFNKPRNETDPESPVGTTICIVSHRFHFPEDSNSLLVRPVDDYWEEGTTEEDTYNVPPAHCHPEHNGAGYIPSHE